MCINPVRRKQACFATPRYNVYLPPYSNAMRVLLLSLVFISFFTGSYGQDTVAKPKVYRHEVGVDATAFLKQFIPAGYAQSTYIPTYYITYRRHCKPGNFRFGFGMNFRTENGPNIDNSEPVTEDNFELDARLGWERVADFHPRWQFFYGLDFRPSVRVRRKTNSSSSGDTEWISTDIAEYYGLAPLMGFRFRCTSRLSLTTETSFSLVYSQYTSKVEVNDASSSMVRPKDEKGKRIYGYHNQPLSVIATFDF